MSRQPAEPEFSRLVAVDGLEEEGRAFRIEAEEEERKALARRFGLLGLSRLYAEGAIFPEANRSSFRLEARLTADVVQSCVVTLAPVGDRLDLRFERLYGTETQDEWDDEDVSGREIFLNLEDDLLPEPFSGDFVDVGEVTAEQLALELNPFPRVHGVAFEANAGNDEGGQFERTETNSPFGALAGLRGKLGSQA